MSRILSIDYGLKRCGIAVTDPLKLIVNGLTTVSNVELIDFLRDYCQSNQVEEIVLGYPLHSDGTKNQISHKIDVLKTKLETMFPEMKVNLCDEKGSSLHAMKILVQSGIGKNKRTDKALLDKMSAVVILQKYLGHI